MQLKNGVKVPDDFSHELSKLDTVFYSGHYTGIAAFELMKGIMGDKLIALHSGDRVI